ncbi:MAG: cytochrome c3 family protein [Acidobacteriota bacterium]|nr:MAG: cytochrome c3 family protein [Acidobacteriota bacterium]
MSEIRNHIDRRSGGMPVSPGRNALPRPGKLYLVPVCVVLLFGLAFAQKKDSCTECHSMLEGPMGEPVKLMKSDIHKSKGLSCADCHGGDASLDDPMQAMDPRKGFMARPKSTAVPAFCGKCHSNADFIKKFNPAQRIDQESEFLTSVHGKLLKQGDQKVATCISCHGNHGVRAVADPQAPVFPTNVAETCAKCHSKPDYMAGYNIPHDQYEKYKKSVHAKALYERQDRSAPTCNSCHGNHGAAPPGVASIANVCGQCHVRQSTLFQASPHKTVFDAMSIGECIQCHNNHEIEPPHDDMIGSGEKSTCTKCHVEGDAGFVAATKMRSRLDELVLANSRAHDILERAERAGMQVSKAKFDLTEARDSLTNARVIIHSFSSEEVEKVIKPGLDIALRSYQAGESAMNELGFRRKGLAVSLFFILFLAGLVYLKIRQIESVKK